LPRSRSDGLTNCDECLGVSDLLLRFSRRERERAYLLINNMYIHPFAGHKEKKPNEVYPDHESPKPIGSLEDETPIIRIYLEKVRKTDLHRS